jgi:hypothetical protein
LPLGSVERQTALASAGFAQPRDDAQQGRLAATRRAQQAQELAAADIESDCAERCDTRVEALIDAAQRDNRRLRLDRPVIKLCSQRRIPALCLQIAT